MIQIHDASTHSTEARRNFNIFLSLFGGLMAVAALLGAIAQALITGNELDPLPVVLFGAAAIGLVNIAGFLLDEKLTPADEMLIPEGQTFPAAHDEDSGRQLE